LSVFKKMSQRGWSRNMLHLGKSGSAG